MSGEQITMLQPTRPTPPRRHRTPASMPITLRRNVDAGLHPMGHPMPEPGAEAVDHTCGDCAHSYQRRGYLKCRFIKPTCGTATDLRARWPACARWVEVSP